ncbi:polyphosphate kinase 1 [Dorea sp. YH-dor228]|uniref:polyphosphate kinase 1 n=1 Tax=Dorea sp. YH-dor228 TaxID=3151120 RepID=UPI003241EADB
MDNMYMNRELSWLKFNERVLEEAENPSVPLCERLTFMSIYQTNMDEFFMVRVGSLFDQTLLQKEIRENKTGMTSQEQVDAILKQTRKTDCRKEAVYDELMECIAKEGIQILRFQDIDSEGCKYLEKYFDSEIAPLISPTVVGRRQPFPFLRNKEIYAVVVLETKNKKERIGLIPCTGSVFGRMVNIPGMQGSYILTEELILHFVSKIFKGYKIKSKSLMRVTRNADIDADALYDEDLDYREFMVGIIKQRKKLAPIRLELSREMDSYGISLLCDYLELGKNHVFKTSTPLDLSFVFQIQDLLRKETKLFFPKRTSQKSDQFQEGRSIIEQIKEEDKLLSYPYESIRPFLHLLNEAAEDKDVVSIKMTLYRVAKQSKVVEALIEAAENGKEVVVLVELRARFDEENNIEWSRRLENAGCQVIYGLDGYKVHSKLCLITRKTDKQIEYITQIGTGNYNEKTSRLYTDLSLMTSNVDIGIEASNVFQALAKGEVTEKSEHLLVAPKCLQNKVLEMLDEEIAHAKSGEEAYAGFKLNSLTDKKIIDKLIEASSAGVKIDMIIRGICCLIPGIEGKTDNIRIISIVGRFLEHSRIYIFGSGDRRKYYIASADFMTRNTVRRVEVAAPVYAEHLKEELQNMFDIMLNDNQKARQLYPDGTYRRVENDQKPLNSQEKFYAMAYHEE